MAKVATNTILDAYLQILITESESNELAVCLCSAEPTTYTQAYTTYMLAKCDIYYPMVGFSAQVDGTTGRKIALGPLVSIDVTNSGTITHLAIVNATDSALYYTLSVDNIAVVAAGKISVGTMYIEIGDPT